MSRCRTIEDVDMVLRGISTLLTHGKLVDRKKAFKQADRFLDERLDFMSIRKLEEVCDEVLAGKK